MVKAVLEIQMAFRACLPLLFLAVSEPGTISVGLRHLKKATAFCPVEKCLYFHQVNASTSTFHI